jgi:hypothetical protein
MLRSRSFFLASPSMPTYAVCAAPPWPRHVSASPCTHNAHGRIERTRTTHVQGHTCIHTCRRIHRRHQPMNTHTHTLSLSLSLRLWRAYQKVDAVGDEPCFVEHAERAAAVQAVQAERKKKHGRAGQRLLLVQVGHLGDVALRHQRQPKLKVGVEVAREAVRDTQALPTPPVSAQPVTHPSAQAQVHTGRGTRTHPGCACVLVGMSS